MGLLPMSGRVDPELRNRPAASPYPLAPVSDTATRTMPVDLLSKEVEIEGNKYLVPTTGFPDPGPTLSEVVPDFVRGQIATIPGFLSDSTELAKYGAATGAIMRGDRRRAIDLLSTEIPYQSPDIAKIMREADILAGSGNLTAETAGHWFSPVGTALKAVKGAGLLGIAAGTLVSARRIKGVTKLGKNIATNFRKADKLAKEGKTPQEIEEATGLIQLPSGDIVYNVSDKGMELVQKASKSGGVVATASPIQGYGRGGVQKHYQSKLGDQIKHPELDKIGVEEYKDLTIIFQPTGSVKGSYAPGAIRLSMTHPEVVKNDLKLRIADNQKEVKNINNALKKEKTSSDGLVVVEGMGRVTPEQAKLYKKSLHQNTRAAKEDLKTIKETGEVPDGYKEPHELSLEQAKSTATHELTHFQQHLGGLQGGANPIKMSPILDVIKRDMDKIPELNDWVKVGKIAEEVVKDTPELSLFKNKADFEKEVLKRYSDAKAAANPRGMGGLPMSKVATGYFGSITPVMNAKGVEKLDLPKIKTFTDELTGVEYRLNNPSVQKVIQVSGLDKPRTAMGADFNLYQGVEGEASARVVQRLQELEEGTKNPMDYPDADTWSMSLERPYFHSLLYNEAPRGTITHGDIKAAADRYGIEYNPTSGSAMSAGKPTGLLPPPLKQISLREKPKKITDPALNIRELPADQAMHIAKMEWHLIPKEGGGFQGGPPEVKTYKDVLKLREEFDAKVMGGIFGSDWYFRARAGIQDIAPKQFQSLTAGEKALFSPQATPEVNLGHAVEQRAAWQAGSRELAHNPLDVDPVTGKPFYIFKESHIAGPGGGKRYGMGDKLWERQALRTRTSDQALKYLEARQTAPPHMPPKVDIAQGMKTDPYFRTLDPTQPLPMIPVNDIQMGRAWNFKNADGSEFSRGFTVSEHRWLDHESMIAVDRANKRAMGGRTDWTVPELQAAAWTWEKGVAEWQRSPEKFQNLSQAIAWAAKTYPEAYPKFDVFETYEPGVPGVGTGHMVDPVTGKGLLDETYAVREDVTRKSDWIDPETGRDLLTDALALYSKKPVEATGHFVGPKGVEISPARSQATQFPMKQDIGGLTLDATGRALMQAKSAFRAVFDFQNMSGWHKLVPIAGEAPKGLLAEAYGGAGAKSTWAGDVGIPMDRKLTQQEMTALSNVVSPYGLEISDTGQGVTLMNFSEGAGDRVIQSAKDTKGLNVQSTRVGSRNVGQINQVKVRFRTKQLTKKQKEWLDDLNDQGMTVSGTKSTYPVVSIQTPNRGVEMERILTKGGLNAAIEQVLPNAGEIYRGRLISDMTDFSPLNRAGIYETEEGFARMGLPGQGQVTRKLLELWEDPLIKGAMEVVDANKPLKKQIREVMKYRYELAKQNNWATRDDYFLLHQIFSREGGNGGFKGLKKALKKGYFLPSVILPVMAYGLSPQHSDAE